jgi:hypothetical protein
MHQLVVRCSGLPVDTLAQLAADVTEEFGHRLHYSQVSCFVEDGQLVLAAQCDFDRTGEALADEFSDAIAANWGGAYGPITIMSGVGV